MTQKSAVIFQKSEVEFKDLGLWIQYSGIKIQEKATRSEVYCMSETIPLKSQFSVFHHSTSKWEWAQLRLPFPLDQGIRK